jgi:NAD-reducing hydrogenase large subunit
VAQQTITIEPVTRIEGHARITVELDAQGKVNEAKFHLTQYRGFEKFCEGRPYREMPALTARTCGICPVSHLMASSKACDSLLCVKIPVVAEQLRRVMNLAQLTQSHALSFFHLSSPDLLLGWDCDPSERNIFGVMFRHRQLAREGIRLRQIGQTIIEMLGGKKVHPSWMVPGGVSEPLTEEKRQTMLVLVDEGLDIAKRTYEFYKSEVVHKFQEEAVHFGNFPTLFLSLVTPRGDLEHYDGLLRIKDANGNIVEDMIPTDDYQRVIGEAVEPFSYMKFPYYRPQGYPQGMYRVGPLARLNNCDSCGTPFADVALAEFRTLQESKPVASSFHYHYARLVEIIFALESMERILRSESILGNRVRARARSNANEGIGIAEAPRGTLIHHYQIDDDGLMTWMNLIIATGHNNLAMNRGITQVARQYVQSENLQEGMLNRVEALIRCYDPCLSCASHAFGQMPIRIELQNSQGKIVDVITRD